MPVIPRSATLILGLSTGIADNCQPAQKQQLFFSEMLVKAGEIIYQQYCTDCLLPNLADSF